MQADPDAGGLGSLGMEVAGVASNGPEALELVERLHPDILITDIRMPGCHGLELIERAKGKLPQLEIVIVSSTALGTGSVLAYSVMRRTGKSYTVSACPS